MKTDLFMLTSLALLAVGTLACAQDEGKERNDHTYSTHNYKHPNKAAAARSWQGNAGVVVRQPAGTLNQQANYKNQAPNQPPVGGVTVYHTPDEQLANRNYKNPMSRPLQSNDSDMARKRTKTPKDTSSVGNE